MADEKSIVQVDDVFDEEGDEEQLVMKEWNKLQSELQKGGYREGIALGKESKLQEGFNEGFSVAGKASYQLAVERGKLSARITFLEEGESSDELQKKLKSIREQELDLINAAKTKDIKDLKMIITTGQSS